MIWFKRLLITLIVLVAVFITAAAVLVVTVDPNDYKDLITEEVHKATGRELHLDGDIHLSLFPWLGLELGAATLSNAPGFGDQAFAGIRDAQVRVAVLPLFKGEVRVDTLRFKGLDINLIRNRAGKTNWDDLAATDHGQEKPPPSGEQGKGPALLAVGGIRIEDAAVHWRDARAGTDLIIKPIDLSTGVVRFGTPFEVDLQLGVHNKDPELSARLTLKTKLTVDPDTRRFRADDMRLHVRAEGESLPNREIETTLISNMDADLERGTISLRPLTLEALALTLRGEALFTRLGPSPHLKAQLRTDTFSPRELLDALGQSAPRTADEGALTRAEFQMALEADPDQVQASGLVLKLDDSTLSGEASVRGFDKPRIDFVLDLDQIDADRYLPPVPAPEAPPGTAPAQAPPETPGLGLPVEALRKLELDGTITVGQLKVANLRVSQTRISIKAHDGLLKIDPARSELYEGQLHGRLSLDVRKPTPRIAATLELSKVQIGKLMQDLQQDKAYIEGLSDASVNIQTTGDSIPALKKSLSGKAALSVKGGSLRDPKLAAKVEAVVAFLQNRKPKSPGEAIIFESLAATAPIEHGVARNRDLTLLTPLILAKGDGDVDIGEDRLDYTLKVALASHKEGKKQLFVPITIKGPFDKLDYGLDLEDIAKERLQGELDKGQHKLQKKLEKKLQKEGGDLGEELQRQLKDKLKFF